MISPSSSKKEQAFDCTHCHSLLTFGSVNSEVWLLLAPMAIVKETDVLNFLVVASKELLLSPLFENVSSSVFLMILGDGFGVGDGSLSGDSSMWLPNY